MAQFDGADMHCRSIAAIRVCGRLLPIHQRQQRTTGDGECIYPLFQQMVHGFSLYGPALGGLWSDPNDCPDFQLAEVPVALWMLTEPCLLRVVCMRCGYTIVPYS